MNKYLLPLMAILVIFPNLGGSSEERQLPEVPRISAELAYLKYKAGIVIIIDAMPIGAYGKYHVLGALNLPNDGPADLERIKNANLLIPKNKEIIVYCD
jgi:rhodanese-related sulfurtransferase